MKRLSPRECTAVSPEQPRVYTTGAFVIPAIIRINGRETWAWIVDEFSDDCFLNGCYCEPVETAESLADLFRDSLEVVKGQRLAP